jgi:hypothetical protein
MGIQPRHREYIVFVVDDDRRVTYPAYAFNSLSYHCVMDGLLTVF